MMEFIKLEDGTEVVIESEGERSDHATLFIACPEEPGAYASVCSFTKKDAKRFRDVLDEWLNKGDEE